MSRATLLRANWSVASAAFTSRPRMRSRTSPAFCADVRTYFAVACACTAITHQPSPAAAAAGATDAALSALVVCPLNARVGANSPSLCPTMFSVRYTGMNFFPLCTASVCPTISGITVERRDQVLRTFFSPPRFMISTFSSSGTSTNGPFFNDLDMISSSQLSAVSTRSAEPLTYFLRR